MKRKSDELKAKFEKQEDELAEVKGKHNTMVACVVLHTIRICHAYVESHLSSISLIYASCRSKDGAKCTSN